MELALPPEIIPPPKPLGLQPYRPGYISQPPPVRPARPAGLLPWGRLSAWRFAAIVLFLAIFLPLTLPFLPGAIAAIDTQPLWQILFGAVMIGTVVALLMAAPIALFILLAVWTFVAVPLRTLREERKLRTEQARQKVHGGVVAERREPRAGVEVSRPLRRLSKDQFPDE